MFCTTQLSYCTELLQAAYLNKLVCVCTASRDMACLAASEIIAYEQYRRDTGCEHHGS